MNPFITRADAFIQDLVFKQRTGKLGNRKPIPAETLAMLTSGQYKLVDATIYVKANIAGKSSDHYILDANSDYKAGTISTDKGRLPKGENLFFDRVQFGYGKLASETDPALIQYTSVINSSNLDLALRHADVIVRSDGNVIVHKPIEEFLVEASPTLPRGHKHTALELGTVQYFLEQKQIEILLRFPNGQTVAASGIHHVAFWFPGVKTMPR